MAVGKMIKTVTCQLVTLMDLVPGTLELTSSHISFYDETNDSLFGSGFDFRFSLKELKEMHMRRYNLRKSALEFFLDDKASYFINFVTAKVYSVLQYFAIFSSKLILFSSKLISN